MTGQLEPSIGFYGVIVLLAIVIPSAAAFGFLAVAVLAVARA